MVSIGMFCVHSSAKNTIKEIPWKIVKGIEASCGLWATRTCENPHR